MANKVVVKQLPTQKNEVLGPIFRSGTTTVAANETNHPIIKVFYIIQIIQFF